MFRRLRVLAVLFLVPVVLFANPQTASAASSGTWYFNLDQAFCAVGWARIGTGVTLATSSRCDAAADYSPFSCQAFEGDCGSYGLVLKDSAGDTCGSAAGEPYDVAGNNQASVAQALGLGFLALADPACVPVQACLSYYWDGPGFSGADEVDCVTVAVDPPDEPDPWEPPAEMPFGSCINGTPQAIAATHKFAYEAGGQTLVKDLYRLLFFNRYPEPGDTVDELNWTLSGAHHLAFSTMPGIEPTLTVQDPTGVWMSSELWKNNPTEGAGGAHNQLDEGPVWAVQVTSDAYGFTMTGGDGGQFGYTNPGECTFYFGPKIRTEDDPEKGMADPWGDLTEIEPEPDPDPEPPVVETPTDAPEFGIPDIGGFLKDLLNFFMGFFGKLKDALKSLLIPDEGFMDDAFADLREAWDDTTVMRFGDAFDDLSVGSVSGCAGIPLNVVLPGGVEVDEHLGAACSGTMATVATVVRSVVNCMLFVGGGIACLRGVGAGFGWRPSIGRGAAES